MSKNTTLKTPLPIDPWSRKATDAVGGWDDPLVGSYIKTSSDDQMYIILARRQYEHMIEVEVEAIATPGKHLVVQIYADTGEIHGVFPVN